MGSVPTPTPAERVEALRQALGARAAGWWRRDGNHLVLLAFAGAPDLPEDVARGFTSATQSVALTETGLGIVRAWAEGRAFVARASELPADTGSGLWLRRFSAERSVAVPVPGDPPHVVSVALPGPTPDDEDVARVVSRFASGSDTR